MEQVAGQLPLVGGEQRFHGLDVGKRQPVGQAARGIDRRGQPKGKVMAGPVDAGDRLALVESAVAVPPAATDVEALEREANRIEELMAGGTLGVGRVAGE